jgi:hypothetical protein
MEKLVQQDQEELSRFALEADRMENDLEWVEKKLRQMGDYAGAAVAGDNTAQAPFTQMLSELSVWAGKRRKSLGRSMRSGPGSSLTIEEAVRRIRAELEPRLTASNVDLAVEIPAALAALPVAGNHIHGALTALLARGIEEVHERPAASLHLHARRKGQRLLLTLEFPAIGPDPEADPTTAWLPSPWVRRRTLWEGLSRAAAHARAMGGRLLVDGSRPGLVRWVLRFPLSRAALSSGAEGRRKAA